jgi:DNA polymerase family A
MNMNRGNTVLERTAYSISFLLMRYLLLSLFYFSFFSLSVVLRVCMFVYGCVFLFVFVCPPFFSHRNGRTSCYGPNIQQIPRRAGFREAFVPSPGHVFLSIDYSFIELCTLAAVCEERYTHSMLGKFLRCCFSLSLGFFIY